MMTPLQAAFIRNLRFFRKKKRFSQLEFSEMINISPNYLNAVENGKNFPSPEVLQNIADGLGIFPYQLFLEYPVDGPDGAEQSRMVQELTRIKQKLMKEIDEIIKKYEGL
ncbi:MAG: helix-turn-helix domain-containing protein [Treponema sp.]|jgi:transcriptional regulator with XRE-family HTH domain|nr:helix-turn-helix domain-containing protein [Treponema sp.]